MGRGCGYYITIVYSRNGKPGQLQGGTHWSKERKGEKKVGKKENLLGHVEHITHESLGRDIKKGIWRDGLQGSVMMG